MKLIDLYRRVPAAKHQNISVISETTVIYDDGANVHVIYIDPKTGDLVAPSNQVRTALTALKQT